MKTAVVVALAVTSFASAAKKHFPTVFMHGMGDSCLTSDMKRIVQLSNERLGSYTLCIPTGTNGKSDTSNSIFMSMNANIEIFAAKVKADPKLAGGFNAIGLSQGNSIIRGYIQKYNDPPVITWISVHGTVSGVASLPTCGPSKELGPKICSHFDEKVMGTAVYTDYVQNHLFQAGYFRDPNCLKSPGYKKYSELAQWNNEGPTVNPTFRENFNKTQRFVMVKALQDTVVYPNEGEHWGHFADGQGWGSMIMQGGMYSGKVLTMKETDWYKHDMFGLKTVDEAGKISFETTTGNHLQFTETELFGWMDKYFMGTAGRLV